MFEVMARLKVRDGELDGFKEQAAEMMRQTRAKDTRTLRYDWFLSDDGSECEVREGYEDPDALIEHAQHVLEAREALFRDFAYDHEMTLYGDPSPALPKDGSCSRVPLLPDLAGPYAGTSSRASMSASSPCSKENRLKGTTPASFSISSASARDGSP